MLGIAFAIGPRKNFGFLREPTGRIRCQGGKPDSRFVFLHQFDAKNVEPNVSKWYIAKPILFVLDSRVLSQSPEAPMAVKNLQTLAVRLANIHGVRVTGAECMGSMRIDGKLQAPLSLPRLPRPGFYPTRTRPDVDLNADNNAATAKAVERTGRSASGAGVLPSAWLARSASGTVLSKRSSSKFWTNRVRG